MFTVEVGNRPIDAATLLASCNDPRHGACASFFGAVRNHNHGRSVVAVSYDGFVPLAEQTLLTIGREAEATFAAELSGSIVHRLGRVAVGELSVGIVVSSVHRNEALLAVRYAIEQIK